MKIELVTKTMVENAIREYGSIRFNHVNKEITLLRKEIRRLNEEISCLRLIINERRDNDRNA